ncbi:P-loop containing nucleoside triphosphate hydrolase protein [Suillus clintonianus]|uniref:P-loop containing nucleoside triphosphate hydrolase protein n=1 Tax=Suillus clintonianus TaxID=1904413 RepID=UPI001B886143|nr:P-loop containing nucleoside triphosphate hydrolase protein [Suillus clintonianus]KAG2153899.1 P-loop containing nucleoside triphosphate hydrolase protein [Suillus clintonianus]
MSLSAERSPSTTFHTSDPSADGSNNIRLGEASHRTETCNIVIFGETGAGKSSLVNLITGTQTAPTSSDTTGCTTKTNVYEHDVVVQDKTLKVNLFDTAGLDEDCQGTVPDKEAQGVLKKLLQTLMEQDGIHLLMYCVQGTRESTALRRNYMSMYSKVQNKVPIVIVVTRLENQEPDMEQWWRKNEQSISKLKMTFAGHACVTTVAIHEDDSVALKERGKQSYRAICELIKDCRLPNEKGVRDVEWACDVHERDHPRNVIVCDSAVPAPMNLCNIAGVINGAWVRSTVVMRGHYYMFQRVTAPYPPAKRSKGGVGFEPCLLIFYVDKDESVDTQRTEVQKFQKVYAKSKVSLVVVVCGCDSDEDAKGWWEGSNNTGTDPSSAPSITFTYLPRDASEHSENAQETLQKLIWELSRPGEPRGSVVRDLLNRVWGYLARVN